MRDRLLRSEADRASLLDLYARIRSGQRVEARDTDQRVGILRLAGITRRMNNQLKVRNRIYDRVFDRDWVVTHMPDAELRRQRTAYRRGLARAAAAGGLIAAIMAGLALTATSQAARANRAYREATRQRGIAVAGEERAQQLAASLAAKNRELAAALYGAKAARNDARGEARRAETATAQERTQRLVADAARGRAEWERQRADEQKRVAVAQRGRAEREQREADRQRRRAEAEVVNARRNLYFAHMSLAPKDWQSHNVDRLRQLLAETEGHEERGFEWAYWQRLCHLELLTLRGHTSPVTCVAYTPDGQRIVTGSSDGTVRLWDAAAGRLTRTILQGAPVDALACSPDGRRVATAGLGDPIVRVWDAGSGRLVLAVRADSEGIGGVAFSPDGQRLATGGHDLRARLWDVTKGQLILTYPPQPNAISGITFSPDGSRLAITSAYAGLVRDAATGREICSLRADNRFECAAEFSPDGRRLVAGSSEPGIWDARTGSRLLTLSGHQGAVGAAVFSPDGGRVITAGLEDRLVRVWDAESGQVLLTHQGHMDAVGAAAFSPDGQRIVTGSADGTARVWDARSGRETVALPVSRGAARSVALSPDGTWFVTASRGDNVARVWDASTGRQTVALQGHRSPVWCVAVSRDGRRIASGSIDHTARLWDASTGRQLRVFSGHAGRVNAIAFSPDSRRLATACEDGSSGVWDLATGRAVRLFRPGPSAVTDVAFSPEGRRLLVTRAEAAAVYDLATGHQELTLIGHAGPMACVTFSRDGRQIVTGSSDRTARVWDAVTGLEVSLLRGHTGPIRALSLSADGRRVLTGSDDGTVRVWDAATGHETLAFEGEGGAVLSTAFSANGRRIVWAGSDGRVRIADAASPAQIESWRTAERAAERVRQQRQALLTAQQALRVIATQTGGATRLDWRPIPGVAGYLVYRGPAGADRGRVVCLTPRPLSQPYFVDRARRAAGALVSYAVAVVVNRQGRLTEVRRLRLETSAAVPPPGWRGSSINEGARSGSVRYHPVSGEITMRGWGADWWNLDACYFANRLLRGDFRITVRVPARPSGSLAPARAGLMIRAPLGAGARHVALLVSPRHGLVFQSRQVLDSVTSPPLTQVLADDALRLPLLLRLTRQGDTVRAEYSLDEGRSFRPAGEPVRLDPSLPDTVAAGLAVTSQFAEAPCEARFDRLTLERLPPAGAADNLQ